MDRYDFDVPILDSSELSKYLTKSALLKNYLIDEEEDNFLFMLLNHVVDGYIDGESVEYEEIKDKFFHKSDRFGRRKLMINSMDKKSLTPYLKDILSQRIHDSCVLYIDYDSKFFEEVILMVSPSILLINVQYLANVVNNVNKKPNLVAVLFGFHCPKNGFWIQASIEKKLKIYNLFK